MPESPSLDPSLTVGSGITSDLYPGILLLAQDPSHPDSRAKAEAKRLSAQATLSGKVAIEVPGAEPVFGIEYDKVFSFDGGIRGHFNQVPKDAEAWSPALQVASIGGKLEGRHTVIIIDTDDGDQIMVSRTSGDRVSADLQTFELLSTKMSKEAGKQGTKLEPRIVDSKTLEGVVAVIGEPLHLGVDPQTGRSIKTRGAVTKVTGFNPQAEPVPAGHPVLRSPDKRRNSLVDFEGAMNTARRNATVKHVGGNALILAQTSPEAQSQISTLSPEKKRKLLAELATLEATQQDPLNPDRSKGFPHVLYHGYRLPTGGVFELDDTKNYSNTGAKTGARTGTGLYTGSVGVAKAFAGDSKTDIKEIIPHGAKLLNLTDPKNDRPITDEFKQAYDQTVWATAKDRLVEQYPDMPKGLIDAVYTEFGKLDRRVTGKDVQSLLDRVIAKRGANSQLPDNRAIRRLIDSAASAYSTKSLIDAGISISRLFIEGDSQVGGMDHKPLLDFLVGELGIDGAITKQKFKSKTSGVEENGVVLWKLDNAADRKTWQKRLGRKA